MIVTADKMCGVAIKRTKHKCNVVRVSWIVTFVIVLNFNTLSQFEQNSHEFAYDRFADLKCKQFFNILTQGIIGVK